VSVVSSVSVLVSSALVSALLLKSMQPADDEAFLADPHPHHHQHNHHRNADDPAPYYVWAGDDDDGASPSLGMGDEDH
jgi:hypothetical protein